MITTAQIILKNAIKSVETKCGNMISNHKDSFSIYVLFYIFLSRNAVNFDVNDMFLNPRINFSFIAGTFPNS